jgi:hypothetical protein
MLYIIVTVLLIVVALFLVCGLLISFFFLARGLSQIDEGTHGTGIGFRLVILPGIIVFWPVLLKKWLQVKKSQ